jgi:hypothetical protein
MNPDDILLWQDGFWCFREELDERFLRNNHYREIPCGTAEAEKMLSVRPTRHIRPPGSKASVEFRGL